MSRAVATPHRLSTNAAVETIERGGNAADAAIAAVAAQGVVAPETCGLGGDLFALVHRTGWSRPRALNASGTAGSNATPEMARAGADVGIGRDDPLAVTIPGCVDGLEALSELGALGLDDALGPAIDLANGGFEASAELCSAFESQHDLYRNNPAVSDFYPGGQPVQRGARVRRPALAQTLRAIAERGREGFYSGTPGQDIVEAVGGVITPADLRESQAMWVEPIGVPVAGLTAWTMPPNSQGYLGPGALAVFEALGPPDDDTDPRWWHLLIEAYRCLAWERSDIVADPEHAPLPEDLLLDPDRLRRAASTVSPHRTGAWPAGVGEVSDTAYLCVTDGEGMSVSLIQSNYHGTGSTFGAARSGFLLHNRGAGFTLTGGHPNQVAPGKRPLHTLSPTLWTDQQRTRWLLGTRGGAIQPQLVAQVAARSILGSSPVARAMDAPRWAIAEFGPGTSSRIRIEPGVDTDVLAALREMGHDIEEMTERQSRWGPMSLIGIGEDGADAVADPRVDTTSAVVW